jgi:MFS family permease
MTHNNELKLGPLWFTPGVSGINLATMFFAAFGTMAMVSFMSFMQPYVLNEMLHIPENEQGGLTGNLHAFQEVVFIAVAGFAGALSDKFGRPLVYAVGFMIAAAGYSLYPLADSVTQLYMARAVFGMGVAGVATMLSACIVDYIQERSRGRWIGVTSVFNGLGILAMSFLLTRLPVVYQNNGATTLAAGRYSFWTVASLCLVIGLVLYFGLFRGGNRDSSRDPIVKKFSAGIKACIRNPRLAIAYGGAFIGRGDFAVIGTFFSLWMVQEGLDKGMTTGEALAIAGPLFGMIQLCALLWAPVMGFITDRLNRLTAVSMGLAICGVGYILMSMVEDPFSSAIYPAGVVLGIGETSVIVSVGALLGQEARGQYQGSIVGVFSLLGGFGILVTTLLGGQLFDGIGRTAPFMMMGLMNLVLMVAALALRVTKHAEPVTETNSQLET